MGLFDFAGNLISSFISADAANSQRAAENDRFVQNLASQKEFAQNGIQWKVADARAAGIHPMAALGANTISYSPMALGDIGSDLRKSSGQDLGRAVSSVSTQETRDKDFNSAVAHLSLERGKLENELLKSQIVRVRQGLNPPPQPVNGSNTPAGLPAAFGSDVAILPPKDWTGAPMPEHQGLRVGKTWLHNPYFSDAQKAEDRYGDIAEEMYGMGVVAPADAFWNWYKSPFYGPGGELDRRVWRHIRRGARAVGDYYSVPRM